MTSTTLKALAAAVVALALLVAAPAVRAHDEYRFVGTITKVDTAKKTFDVTFKEQGKDETVQIWLPADVTVTRDDAKVPQTELKVGLTVVVDAAGDTYDSLEAVAIRIVPPPSR